MRFLMIPELRQGETWKFAGVIDHPYYKHGPHYHWNSNRGRSVMINRQLFHMMMLGRM